MTRVMILMSLAGFAAGLVARAVDPIIPPIAADFGVDPRVVALLSSAFALPFAITPPFFGPLGDIFGKIRLVRIALVILTVSGVAAFFATSFETLFGARMLAGVAAGGVFPMLIAIFGDLVPVASRQVALGRLLTVVITGNLLGAALAGVVADFFGWRAVFVVLTLVTLGGLASVTFGLRGVVLPRVPLLNLKSIPQNYRGIFRNPRAKYVLSAVFIEGTTIFGLMPYVSVFLHTAGEERASIAGLVIGGFSCGGLLYGLLVVRLLARFKPVHLLIAGAAVAALAMSVAAFQPSWPVQFVAFVALGCGFYTMHGYIQVQSTELSATARGAAVALHSSFFLLGGGVGPVLYGFSFGWFGVTASVLVAALTLFLTGLVLIRGLARADRAKV